MDISALAVILQLVFLEGILSLDNAAVLGALVSRLPAKRMIPWPRALRFMRRPALALLGRQRSAALKAGLLGAYAGRGAMLFFAGLIISNPWIRIAGAGYLLFLVFRYFSRMCRPEPSGDGPRPGVPAREWYPGFWRTVLSVELADLAFSVDNVVAAVALSPGFWVTLAGVGIGMIVMRFAASVFARMIEWEPALSTGAYLLIAAVGLELVLDSAAGIRLTELEQFGISASIVALTILFARTRLRRLSRFLSFIPAACARVTAFAKSFRNSVRIGGRGGA